MTTISPTGSLAIAHQKYCAQLENMETVVVGRAVRPVLETTIYVTGMMEPVARGVIQAILGYFVTQVRTY